MTRARRLLIEHIKEVAEESIHHTARESWAESIAREIDDDNERPTLAEILDYAEILDIPTCNDDGSANFPSLAED